MSDLTERELQKLKVYGRGWICPKCGKENSSKDRRCGWCEIESIPIPDGLKERIEAMKEGKMTDAELVERVARGYGISFEDINGSDTLWLFAVLDNFDEWYIEKSDGQYFCELGTDVDNASTSDTLPRAVLTAALKAKGEKEEDGSDRT